ncbi:LysR family transcriptional regulator [Nocardia sp. NBC_01009]|uniref:LysR family transcriptional regulator n=1 Tax=Nocardia sp. NBC_01009 TaxID=2975996 RepID=UPI00386EF5AF|nr:LysR family transcriptional regulator [Nocardia sp. NBC_01009]
MELRTLRYFVAVAEELHFGRAAARLHMTQPPLSRAIKQLELDLDCELLHRSSTGVTLTPAGVSLYEDAQSLLARAEQIRARTTAAAGPATLTIGTLTDSAEQSVTRLADAYRQRHPHVRIHIRDADFTNPTAGLRSSTVDVALTRAPFDLTGLTVHVLRSDPIGVVLRADDPLATREQLHPSELSDRRWFRLPADTDPLWRAFWTPPNSQGSDGPVVRTANECLQVVLWNGTVGLTPLSHPLPDGLVAVPLADMPRSDLVLAIRKHDHRPLIRAFTHTAAELYREISHTPASAQDRGSRNLDQVVG